MSSVAIVDRLGGRRAGRHRLSFGRRPLRWLLRGYVDFVRGTPVLVLILASFYILAIFGVQFSATGAGMFALSLFCGAHLGEIVRGGLAGDPRRRRSTPAEVSASPCPRSFSLVLLPQAFRQVLPVWVNTAVEIVKASTLLSVIGVGELLLKTQEVVGRTFFTLEFYLFAGSAVFPDQFCDRAARATGRTPLPTAVRGTDGGP